MAKFTIEKVGYLVVHYPLRRETLLTTCFQDIAQHIKRTVRFSNINPPLRQSEQTLTDITIV